MNFQTIAGFFRTSGSRYPALSLVIGLLLAGCGGGGGGGSAPPAPPPPPPPPPTVATFTLELTSVAIEDTRNGTAVDPTGLPIGGATASLQN